jgi:8-oxo-dGTP pyrophosphatase MutT (NUDIX family)
MNEYNEYNYHKRRVSDTDYDNYKKNNSTIKSSGLILYYDVNKSKDLNLENNNIENNFYFLIQQRRDTFEYADTIQGLWESIEQLKHFFTLMSCDERERISTYSFDKLWEDIWVEKTAKTYINGYKKAKRKFEDIANIIPELIRTTNSSIASPPWGFPKGRKLNTKENNYDCAIRETEEETRIPKSEYKITSSHSFVETFQGTDGINYSTTYFLAEIKNMIIPEAMSVPNCIRTSTISEEVKELKWITYLEAPLYLNSRLQLLLSEAIKVLNDN